MLIDTATESAFLHPFASVPVTTYVVAEEGVAVGLEMFGLFNPEEGDHTYEVPPVTVSEAEPPAQTEVSENAVITGNCHMKIATESVFEHPFPSVTVTV